MTAEGAIVRTAVRGFKLLGVLVQKAGPYLLLELLLPGGTLLALLLFLLRWQEARGATRRGMPMHDAIGKLRAAIACIVPVPHDIASLWRGRHRERDGLEALAIGPTL